MPPGRGRCRRAARRRAGSRDGPLAARRERRRGRAGGEHLADGAVDGGHGPVVGRAQHGVVDVLLRGGHGGLRRGDEPPLLGDQRRAVRAGRVEVVLRGDQPLAGVLHLDPTGGLVGVAPGLRLLQRRPAGHDLPLGLRQRRCAVAAWVQAELAEPPETSDPEAAGCAERRLDAFPALLGGVVVAVAVGVGLPQDFDNRPDVSIEALDGRCRRRRPRTRPRPARPGPRCRRGRPRRSRAASWPARRPRRPRRPWPTPGPAASRISPAWSVVFSAPATVVALTSRVSAACWAGDGPCCCSSTRRNAVSSTVARTSPSATFWPTLTSTVELAAPEEPDVALGHRRQRARRGDRGAATRRSTRWSAGPAAWMTWQAIERGGQQGGGPDGPGDTADCRRRPARPGPL